MGTYSGLHFLKKENDKWKYHRKLKGFNHPGRSFAEDNLGDIWVSNENRGLFKLRLNSARDSVAQLKLFSDPAGHTLSQGNTILRLQDDVLITTSNGVYRYDYDSEKLIPFEAINRILGDHGYLSVKKIIPEASEELWIVDQQGVLIKIKVARDTAHLLQSTELLRGKTIGDFEHVNPIDEAIVVGTLEGFALYTQHSTDSVLTPLKVFISRVETQDQIISDGNYEIKELGTPVAFSDNALKFTFASNSYEDLNTNQYQYYLEGFSPTKKWSPPTFVPFKEYSNLHEGNIHYTYARSISGIASAMRQQLRLRFFHPGTGRGGHTAFMELYLSYLTIYFIGLFKSELKKNAGM